MSTTAVEWYQPVLSESERVTLLGFLAGGAHPSSAYRLRVPGLAPGPQRTRRDPRHRRHVVTTRSRTGVVAGAERAARLRSDRHRHRSARPRTRTPHPHGVAQGRQDRDDAARPTRRPCCRPRHRRTLPKARSSPTRMASVSTGTPPVGSCDASPATLGIAKRVGPHTLRHAFITAALDAGVPLRDVQEAASHADPRTTMRYDRGRQSLDRHATYIVATFIAGASR